YTPLHHAAGRGFRDVIDYLLEHGADPTAISRSGQSAADMANGPVSLGAPPFPDIIEHLLSLGATLNFDCVYCWPARVDPHARVVEALRLLPFVGESTVDEIARGASPHPRIDASRIPAVLIR